MSPAICFNFDQSKILSSGNELTLPNHTILDMIKLKAFTDDKINFFQIIKLFYDRVENIVG